MLDFDKITIDIKAMSLDKAEAVNLRSKLWAGSVGAQYDDRGNKIWTSLSAVRELKSFEKKIKKASNKKKKP
jgi:hypothetical protein